jgi:hypothetical protein
MADDKLWCVYKHTCPDGRCYVGITSKRPEERWSKGLGYERSNRQFFLYILENGWNNIKHEVLYDGLSEREARKIEREKIVECGEQAFNIVHMSKHGNALINLPSLDEKYLPEEVFAIRLWTAALYGDIEKNCWVVAETHAGWKRTVLEIVSGDKRRILKELNHINKEACCARGVTGKAYSDDEITEIASKWENGTLFESYRLANHAKDT